MTVESGTRLLRCEGPHKERHCDRDNTRYPVDRFLEHALAIPGEQEGGEEGRHEENEGVEDDQDAKPSQGLAQQLRRQRRGSAREYRGMSPALGQEHRWR
jgi:hypothetical protein